MEAHLEDLRAEVRDDELVERLRRGWRTAGLGERVEAILGFAERAAGDASGVRPEDVERLREAGLEDADVLDLVSVVALFSYFNVVADALGVDDEPEWEAGGG